ncbi:MAG TPA: FAD:protein FMN transferase [Mycobacteriales bacterium]|nr:FAD:protein FMN transferase [Mycobacteriales bacterium]
MTALRSVPASQLVAAPVFAAGAEVCGEWLEVTVVGGDAGVVEDARDRLIELLSRFDPSDPASELSRLNAGSGSPVSCSWETLLLASLLDDASAGHVVIDTAQSTATVAQGRQLEPGRVAAGVALDMVVQDLEADGVTGAGVQLGRDLRVVGTSPYAGGWTVDVAGKQWRVPAGAAITVDGGPGGVDSVTVLAETGWQAATLAHRVAAGTVEAAQRELEDAATPGVLVVAGEVIEVGLPATSQVDVT